jgi:hypothetical protein
MAHNFVTNVHNETILCHHSIEWHSSPQYNCSVVSLLSRMARRCDATVEWHGAIDIWRRPLTFHSAETEDRCSFTSCCTLLHGAELNEAHGQLYLHTDPGQLYLHTDPGQLYLHTDPGPLYLHTDPGQLYLHTEPWQLYLHTDPGQLNLTLSGPLTKTLKCALHRK